MTLLKISKTKLNREQLLSEPEPMRKKIYVTYNRINIKNNNTKILRDILCKYKNFFEKLGKQQKGLLEVLNN